MQLLIKIIGFLATFTSTISLIPQLIQSYKTKSVNDISIWMLWNFLFSSVLWLIYGIMINSFAVSIANVIMTMFSLWTLVLKLQYDKS